MENSPDTKRRLSSTSRDAAGSLGWVCRRRWKGLGLGEEAEVNLTEGKDEGDSKSCVPHWLLAGQEGKQLLPSSSGALAKQGLFGGLRRAGMGCSRGARTLLPGPEGRVAPGVPHFPAAAMPEATQRKLCLRGAIQPLPCDAFVVMRSSSDCLLAAQLALCSTGVSFMSVLNCSANEPVNLH